ncbi:UPF0175 family protein [Methanocalculus alkaliphilus]|uniref:UPF0175 family protein n=1 Tax=Methanocalculus alkaliphilus TaxID=768730 RepID=UPI00209E190E|nr:UPF0175 family protein [Methanocalculus alkaliphilus]
MNDSSVHYPPGVCFCTSPSHEWSRVSPPQGPCPCSLYEGILSSGKAAGLAGLKRCQWEVLLGVWKVSRHCTEEDLHVDIACGSSVRYCSMVPLFITGLVGLL